MKNNIPIGIAAGIVSALFATVLATGLAPMLFLLYFSPLPILVVSLGWRHQTGLIATAAGGLALLPLSYFYSMVMVLGIGLPAWWIAYLLLLGRTTDVGIEWYPLGRILLTIVWIAIALLLAMLYAIGDGSYDRFVEQVRSFVTLMTPQFQQVVQNFDAEAFAQKLVIEIPSSFPASVIYIFVLNIWMAARFMLRAARLPRPWPYIPAARMPPTILLVGACGIGLTFLEGFPRLAGLGVLGAASAALLLQGLCLLHFISQKWPQRRLILGVIYVAVILQPMLAGTILVYFNLVLIGIGVADVVFNIRHKFGSGDAAPSR